jgi:hypothetical protein
MTVNIYSENIFRITRKGPPEKFLKEAYESCIIQKIEQMRKEGGQSKDADFFTESDLSNTDSGNKLLKIS